MNYTDFDDIRLLELLKREDEEGFAVIYNRYWKLLYTTAYNILHDEDVAKDAVQEVFISLWRRRQHTTIQTLKAYLQQAVRFQILKFIKAEKTNEAFYGRLAAATADIAYENPLLFKEHEALLKEIVDGLPQDCKLVFNLSRQEGLTYKQIADHLSISEKTVEKKMSICLKHIRQRLEDNLFLLVILFLASAI